jgi:hypothetical protein
MTMTMPAVGGPRGPQPGRRRHQIRTLLTILALVVLLIPLGYLFTRQWVATGDAATTTTAERAAVAYARPVDKLLAALVDAQYTASRGAAGDLSGVRSAVDDVNAVDREQADPLDLRPRWTQLRQEIDNALSQNPSGPDALHVYAAPIALTQALLDRIADASRASHDSTAGAFQLSQVALRSLPAVLVNAGQLSALGQGTGPEAATTGRTDPALPIAEDRLTQAATEVSTGLRGGTDPGATYAVDLNLLGPLDEFAAAADALNQTANGLAVPGSGARDRLDAAYTQLESKALTLEAAVFDAFDNQVGAHTDRDTGQRRILYLLAVVGVLAMVALLWLRVPRSAAPVPSEESAEGRHRYPAADESAPDGATRMPDLVDARDLLGPQLVRLGRPPGAPDTTSAPDRAGHR